MAAVEEPPKVRPLKQRSRREQRHDGGTALSTYGLLMPMLILLGLFFLAPLYYIVLFSLALKRFAPTDALAALNGELNAFTTELWGQLLSNDVIVKIPGIDFNVPVIIVGIVFVVLLALAVSAGRIREYGSWIVGIAFVLLLVPFLTFPAGNNLLRLMELSSDGQYLRLFFKSVTMARLKSTM